MFRNPIMPLPDGVAVSLSNFVHEHGDFDLSVPGAARDLVERVVAGFSARTPGYRDGVVLVPIDPAGIRCQIVDLVDGDVLQGTYAARVAGEAPRKAVRKSGGDSSSAATVSAVLYRTDVLAEDDYRTDQRLACARCKNAGKVKIRSVGIKCPDCLGNSAGPPLFADWEVITVIASPTQDTPPMDPDTLLHNHFGSDGGTATNMSDSDFVAALRESFLFWKDRARLKF